MIRLILVVVYLFLFLVFSIPVLIADTIIKHFNPVAADRLSLAVVQWVFRCIKFLSGTEAKVIGEENVPTDTPVLYIANHQSFFDVVLTYARVPNLTGYIAKKSIYKVPIFGFWMKKVYCLSLDRADVKQGLKVILTAIDQVKHGISIFIFPEGTRTKDGSLGQFHSGSFKVATKTGCPIVPVAIKGTSAVFEDHFPFVRKATATIIYGKPIYPDSLDEEDKKHIAQYTRNIILNMLEEPEQIETTD
ncbi:MAG: 1-acyl-sn-glycerol-3-phosphate acyltransferase [Lachnospiraceae bacterium]|nr:1-acyl-sn-glycerol-3-phosphate acyltransferase [Lachnospiraceae bacterium]